MTDFRYGVSLFRALHSSALKIRPYTRRHCYESKPVSWVLMSASVRKRTDESFETAGARDRLKNTRPKGATPWKS